MEGLQKILLKERIDLIGKLESREPNTKFIVFVSSASIDYDDAIKLYDVIRKFGKVETIKLIIDSPGGDPDAAYKIVMLLRQYCERLVAVVPFTAKSAATLITLGTDEIEMGPISELGPIDPQTKINQLGWGSAQSVRDCIDYLLEKVENIKSNYSDDSMGIVVYPIIDKLNPFLIGSLERAVKASKQYAKALLCNGMLDSDGVEVNELVSKLSEGYFSHGYAIGRKEAKELGLTVKFIDDEYWNDIWRLYSSYHFEKRILEKKLWNIDSIETLQQELLEFTLEDIGCEDETGEVEDIETDKE